MLSLYYYNKDKKECGYLFRTTKPYKARSHFWKLIDKRDIKQAGIYLHLTKEDINSLPDEEKSFFNNRKEKSWKDENIEYNNLGIIELKEGKRTKDTGLLIIAKDLKIENTEVKGEIILLSGFSRYGTYELGRMISKVINKDEDPENKITLTAYNSDDLIIEVTVNDFIGVVNDIKKEEKPYCIEAVFEFNNEDFFIPEATENRLMTFYKFDRKSCKRESLLKCLVLKSINAKIFQKQTSDETWLNAHRQNYIAIVDSKLLLGNGKEKKKFLDEVRKNFPKKAIFFGLVSKFETIILTNRNI
jgi:hypothetical protein